MRRGIEINEEHPLVSRDMELMLAGISEARAKNAAETHRPPAETETDAETDVSAAHLLLQRYADKTTKH